jgi:salicylate hydroxylase
MAVEDGAVLGRLLSRFAEHQIPKTSIPALLEVYQHVRKRRAQTTVRTANGNRKLYHMDDGPEQEERDRLFAQHDWWDENISFPWVFADLPYLRELFGFDTLKSAEDAFSEWVRSNEKDNDTAVNGSV